MGICFDQRQKCSMQQNCSALDIQYNTVKGDMSNSECFWSLSNRRVGMVTNTTTQNKLLCCTAQKQTFFFNLGLLSCLFFNNINYLYACSFLSNLY